MAIPAIFPPVVWGIVCGLKPHNRSDRLITANNLGLRRGEIAGDAFRLKAVALVSAVAKRLILRKAAAAKRDYAASSEPVDISLRILNREIAFETYGTVVYDGYFHTHFPRW